MTFDNKGFEWLPGNETFHWCPFCSWTLFYDYYPDLEDLEELLQSHLDMHIDEMMTL